MIGGGFGFGVCFRDLCCVCCWVFAELWDGGCGTLICRGVGG